MTIHIHTSELSEEVRKLYFEENLISLHLDYAPGCLMGWVRGENREVIVYDFNNFAKLVNKHDYKIYKNANEIIINIQQK